MHFINKKVCRWQIAIIYTRKISCHTPLGLWKSDACLFFQIPVQLIKKIIDLSTMEEQTVIFFQKAAFYLLIWLAQKIAMLCFFKIKLFLLFLYVCITNAALMFMFCVYGVISHKSSGSILHFKMSNIYFLQKCVCIFLADMYVCIFLADMYVCIFI